jgi:hypothetical protein
MSVTPLIRSKIGFMRSSRALWVAVSITWLFLAANIGFSIYDHFVPRPFASGVSPIGGSAVAPPVPPALPNARIYTDKTVAELTALCATRTSLQCDAFMTDQKGKWLKAEGKMQTVWGDGLNVHMLFFSDLTGIYCQFDGTWKDRLNALRPFEAVKVIGEIGPTQPSGQIYLLNCELQ